MKLKKLFLAALILLIGYWCFGESDELPSTSKNKKIDASLLSLSLTPGMEYPLDTEKDLLRLGYSVDLSGGLPLPFLPLISPTASLSYSYIPVQADTSLSIITLGLGGELKIELGPRLFIHTSLLGGGYYSFFNKTLYTEEGIPYDNQQGGNPFFTAGGGVSFYLTPYFSIGLNGYYKNYIGLYHGIRGSLGTSFHVHGFQRQVRLHNIELDSIFPAFFQYYDNHSIGRATIINNERFQIKNIRASLFVRQFMDSPKTCISPSELKPGKEGKIEINALFLDSVLDIKEDTKVAADIIVNYTLNGIKREYVTTETMYMHHRNAMTWDDDRKAAAFISAKDPDVLKFSKIVAGMIRDKGPKAINQNLRMGLGLFEAMSSYGLNYVIDPNTPSYAEASKSDSVIDFLQFPKETLEYRGGDCDDLSILYCALLESIGIETAFITIPGHIFIAFSLDMNTAEAKNTFLSEDSLIFHEDQTWLPVEVTKVGNRFLDAWRIGAKQWQDNVEKNTAGFFPIHQNWQVYQSAGSPGGKTSVDIPPLETLETIYKKEIDKFVERELYPKVAKLQEAISKSNNPEKLMNRLGVLYARYGLTEKAERVFRDILRQKDYVPAMINLGNIYYLKEDMDTALDYYKRVEEQTPGNTVVLLNMARINYELKQYALAKKYYNQLSNQKPELGQKFSYLASTDASKTRAEDMERVKEIMLWEEE